MNDSPLTSDQSPRQCDICRRSDWLDPVTGDCARCVGLDKLLFLGRFAPLRNTRLRDVWIWWGGIGRAQYALLGILLVLLKSALNGVVFLAADHQWRSAAYLSPSLFLLFETADQPLSEKLSFAAIALALSLPFIWAGTALTLRRLRSADLPLWLVACFFLPIANWIFFFVLCLVPPRKENHVRIEAPPGGAIGAMLGRMIPESRLGSATVSALLVLLPAALAVFLSVNVLKVYGAGLFVGLPFCIGLGTALLHGYHRERTLGDCFTASLLALLILGAALLATAFEGVICLLMAAPIAGVILYFGTVIGYLIQCRPNDADSPYRISLVVCLLPFLMWLEQPAAERPYQRAVVTTVDVAASPETVWRHVVSFAEIPPDDDWVFKTGIAYPLRATIVGRGPGAIRYCTFSTGSFVEPIAVWDEPRLLQFSVAAQPDVMQEWSPYAELHPPHLDSYLRSRRGQFKLTPLPGGGTRIEGTTWYEQKIRPAGYWNVWSDWIIHRIHRRVLTHIKRLSESPVQS